MHNYYNLLLLIILEYVPFSVLFFFAITVMYYIRNFININFYCENSFGGGGEGGVMTATNMCSNFSGSGVVPPCLGGTIPEPGKKRLITLSAHNFFYNCL